jgi:preprotein translocase subunit SecB
MKASPVQMLQLFFKKVDVEFDPRHAPAEVPNPLTNVFTFDGVSLNTEVTLSEADLNHERGQLYAVSVRLMIQNEADESPTVKFSPYKLNVAADALILVVKGAEKLDLPENLATVNGASLLWSAIREQVLNITSRMQAGPVMLPTVHFHDLKKAATSSAIIEEDVALKKHAVRKPRASTSSQGI